MAALFGITPTQAQQPTAASGVNIQTSVYGQCIPLVFGTTVVAPEIIWSGNFQSHAHSSGGASGGKGGSTSGGGTTSYTYTDGVVLALCEGPIKGVGTIWQGSTAYTASALGYEVFYGSYPQEGWADLAAWNMVVEQHVVPSTAPYVVQVNYPALATVPISVGKVVSGGLTAMTKVSTNPAAGQYCVTATAGSTSTYQFAEADVGKSVQIGSAALATIPDSLVNGPVLTGAAGAALSIMETATTASMVQVTGTLASGQYSLSGGTFKFAAADIGQWVTFDGGIPVQIPNSRTINPTGLSGFTDGGVLDGGGVPLTKVNAWNVANANISAVAGANEYEVDTVGNYTFNAVNAGEAVTISYTSPFSQPVNQGLNYNGLAYIANLNLNLGSANSLPNHQVELFGQLTSPQDNQIDVNPAGVAQLLLTNTEWGLGILFPANLIGNLTNYSNYCAAMGLLMSAAYTQQTTAAQMLDDLTTFTNADVAWTTTFNIIPRGDQAITANGVTYTPPPLTFALTDDHWWPVNNASTATGSQVSDALVGIRRSSVGQTILATLRLKPWHLRVILLSKDGSTPPPSAKPTAALSSAP